ncbi:MAG: DNA polymerase III subunit delta [Clostridia bacterium]|nr:DNA polymerase III subunit delta [Clostridia bacterium]
MNNLRKNLEKGVLDAYHIKGNDLFLIEEACRLIEKACKNEMGDLNRAVFTDENFSANELISVCNQIPMFAEKRFVLVKNIIKIADSELKKLIQYSKNPSDSCVLVLCEMLGLSVFDKMNFEKVVCNKLNDFELKKIIVQELNLYDKEITPEAINLLIDFCLKDLMLIKSEIKKLGFFKLGKALIDEDIIKKLVHKNETYSVFEISDALTHRQGDRAIFLLKKMLETKDFPFVLGLISSHFRRLLYSAMSEGTDAEIASKMGVKEYAITKARQLSKNFKLAQLVKINELILDVDYQIKDGQMANINAMYFLVFAILEVMRQV